MKPEAYQKNYDKSAMPMVLPDFIAKNVVSVDIDWLSNQLGVKHVLLDVDLTLRPYRAKNLGADLVDYLSRFKKSGVIKSLNLVTNNRGDLSTFSSPISANVFQPQKSLRKPNPEFFRRVLGQLKAKPDEAVMIGDKLRPDVLGANRVGIYTVWVEPLGRDYWYDRFLLTRLRERIAIKRVRKQWHK